MRLARRASWRHLVRHPAQLALCVLGVALGVAVVVSIDLAVASARSAFRASAETVSGRATHQVVPGPGGLPDSTVAAIRIGVGLRASAPVVEGFVESDALPRRALRILGVDPLSEPLFRPFAAGGAPGVDVGTLLTEPRAVLLLTETAAAAGVERGDALTVLAAGRETGLWVAGTLRADDRLTAEGLQDVLLMDVAAAQEVLGRVGSLDRIDLIVPEGLAGEEILRSVSDVVPASAALEPVGVRTDSMTGMIAAFDLNLQALSLLAMVFGMFLVFNALSFSVVQRRELYGRLRGLGVTRRGVLRSVLAEAAALGAVGSAAGLLLGVVLGRGLVGLVTRTINDLYFVVTVRGLELEPAILVKGAALGIGTTLLAAIPAARAAAAAAPRVAQSRSPSTGPHAWCPGSPGAAPRSPWRVRRSCSSPPGACR